MAEMSRGFTRDVLPRQVRAETRKPEPAADDREGMGAAIWGAALCVLGVLAMAALCCLAESC